MKKIIFVILVSIAIVGGWFFVGKYIFFQPNYYGLAVPSKPSEVFNMSAIKNVSLGNLQWRQSFKNIKDGVQIIDGDWSPGPYTGPTADGKAIKTITLASQMRIYFPQSAVGKKIPVLVEAAHL